MESKEELFTCHRCEEIVFKFPFIDEKDKKFCSPFCRRKAGEARKAAVEALEAGTEDTVPRKAG